MTREQAIKTLKWFKDYNEEDYCGGDRIQDEHGDWYYRITEQDFEAFDVAIKALEQEPILDKVRAEIEEHCGLAKENHCRYCSYCNNLMGVREILEIIDKHKAETENT